MNLQNGLFANVNSKHFAGGVGRFKEEKLLLKFFLKTCFHIIFWEKYIFSASKHCQLH